MPSTAITWATPPRTSPSSARSPAQQQDEFAVESQNKAEAAQKAGKFKDEIAPVTIKSRKGDIVVDTDEYPQARRHARSDRQAAPGLRQGRHRHGRQCLRHQRWRRRRGADEGARSRQARQDAAGPHRVLGACRRRSGDHGHRPDPGLARGAEEGRLEGRRPRSDRGQRGLRRAGLRGQQGPRLGHRQGQRQWRRHRASAIRSAPPARACW